MSRNSFFPTKDADQIVWLTNYAAKLPLYAAVCGIGEQEVKDTLTDVNYDIWMRQHWGPALQRDLKDATVKRLLMQTGNSSDVVSPPKASTYPEAPLMPPPGIHKRLFSQIIRIKASVNYNESIGQILGLISITTKVEHSVPEFILTLELGAALSRVRIDFKKYGHDGIWIESRINGGDWAFLAIDTVKPYLDERPLAAGNSHETREYRLRWWDKSEPHGEWSAVQRVVLGS